MDELIKRLRNCATGAAPCNTCDLAEDVCCTDTLMKQAADAIEELNSQLDDFKRLRLPLKENRLYKYSDGRLVEVFLVQLQQHTRPSWCPLAPVPPHGRLIDADALMLKILDYIEEYSDVDEKGWHNLKWCAMKEAEMAIKNAPTIIEAEEGET